MCHFCLEVGREITSSNTCLIHCVYITHFTQVSWSVHVVVYLDECLSKLSSFILIFIDSDAISSHAHFEAFLHFCIKVRFFVQLIGTEKKINQLFRQCFSVSIDCTQQCPWSTIVVIIGRIVTRYLNSNQSVKFENHVSNFCIETLRTRSKTPLFQLSVSKISSSFSFFICKLLCVTCGTILVVWKGLPFRLCKIIFSVFHYKIYDTCHTIQIIY